MPARVACACTPTLDETDDTLQVEQLCWWGGQGASDDAAAVWQAAHWQRNVREHLRSNTLLQGTERGNLASCSARLYTTGAGQQSTGNAAKNLHDLSSAKRVHRLES